MQCNGHKQYELAKRANSVVLYSSIVSALLEFISQIDYLTKSTKCLGQ